MTHASLFSGFGGFDLTAEWVGWTNLFNCEIDPFCRRLLAYHFPHAKQYADVRTTDFSVWRGRVDVLTGGFPCQPFSAAGKRKGTADSRHLWPEMLRAIREIRPRWVVGENVLGIIDWSGGVVFEQVLANLETEGYEVEAYVLPACGVGAPHRRYRVWFVAHANDSGIEGAHCEGLVSDRPDDAADAHSYRCGLGAGESKSVAACISPADACAGSPSLSIACSDGQRCDECVVASGFVKTEIGAGEVGSGVLLPDWSRFPTQSPVCRGDDGLPDRLDDITFPAWCRHSIKGFGNAIVPQVFLQIAESINEYERTPE